MSMLVGFTGLKGSGKDTAAQFLVENCEFTRHAFADKLKEAVAALFDISLEDVDRFKTESSLEVAIDIPYGGNEQASYTWREFLQRFGTEMGRNCFGQNFWVEQWLNVYYELLALEHNVVATDVRFVNEAAAIRQMGGVIVEITRPGLTPDGHASEEPLPRSYIDTSIANNGSIEALHVDVHDLHRALQEKTRQALRSGGIRG